MKRKHYLRVKRGKNFRVSIRKGIGLIVCGVRWSLGIR
jgi:hypothetical protein